MTETERLEDLEDDIEAFQQHKLKAGQALWEIRRNDLYENRGYGTVAAYAKDRYGISSGRVTQLINYARVSDILGNTDQGTPANEAQARPLGNLLDEEGESDIPNIWELAVSRHGLNDLSKQKVHEAKKDFYATGGEEEDIEPSGTEVDLHVPIPTADEMNLQGDNYRASRIVPFDGMTRSDVKEIIENANPIETAPPNTDEDPVLGSKSWEPIRGENSIALRADDVQRLQHASVPPSNQGRAMEGVRTLTCPGIDLLSGEVPDVFTQEVLERSSGTDWKPVLLSSHVERWTNHSLPDEGWVGARADRSSIEHVADVFSSADETAVKWVLYDLGGEDREEGFPETDLSVLDWVVIDEIDHPNIDLPNDQLQTLRQSAVEKDIALAVRTPFTSTLKTTP